MTTIRMMGWQDLFRQPLDDEQPVDDEVMTRNSLGPYNLVAEAPGNHIMGYLYTSAFEDKDTHQEIVRIDKCSNHYSTKPLVSELEEILKRKKVYAIFVDLPESSAATLMFSQLGYKADPEVESVKAHICRWFKILEEAGHEEGEEEAEQNILLDARAELAAPTSPEE